MIVGRKHANVDHSDINFAYCNPSFTYAPFLTKCNRSNTPWIKHNFLTLMMWGRSDFSAIFPSTVIITISGAIWGQLEVYPSKSWSRINWESPCLLLPQWQHKLHTIWREHVHNTLLSFPTHHALVFHTEKSCAKFCCSHLGFKMASRVVCIPQLPFCRINIHKTLGLFQHQLLLKIFLGQTWLFNRLASILFFNKVVNKSEMDTSHKEVHISP